MANTPNTDAIHLTNIILPSISPDDIDDTTNDGPPPTYDVTITDHCITSITPSSSVSPSTPNPKPKPRPLPAPLLLPTLTHPHIHLDKPYLLTSHSHPHRSYQTSYADLAPQSGTFAEALAKTAEAKSRFTTSDLLLRGRQLLATSFTQGVTSVRAFVEVDHVVGEMCVEAGLRLQREFWGASADAGGRVTRLVKVQLCAFAQDPIFSTEYGEENRGLLEGLLGRYAVGGGSSDGKAASKVEDNDNDNDNAQTQPVETPSWYGIEVLGSTPYVETSRAASLANIEWAILTALRHDLHLDFHLDYNLNDPTTSEDLLVWDVLRLLRKHGWPTDPATALNTATALTTATAHRDGEGGRSERSRTRKRRTVVLGHCTALTTLSHQQLQRLAAEIRDSQLPVYFVGLPTSDLYMMGRPAQPDENTVAHNPLNRPRGTLNTTYLSQQYGLKAVLGVNNVGNAFTPYGSGDPLDIAGWCVGLQQDGTETGVRRLFWAVAGGAREAIGLGEGGDEAGQEEDGDGHGQQGKRVGWLREGTDVGEFGMLVIRNEEFIQSSTSDGLLGAMKVPARPRWGIKDVVWDVPRVELRRVVR